MLDHIRDIDEIDNSRGESFGVSCMVQIIIDDHAIKQYWYKLTSTDWASQSSYRNDHKDSVSVKSLWVSYQIVQVHHYLTPIRDERSRARTMVFARRSHSGSKYSCRPGS